MTRSTLFVAAALLAALATASGALAQEAPGTTFRDCPECPEMVVVPGGRFVMGATPGEEEREGLPEQFRGRSQPRVAVSIGSFALGRYEVTRGDLPRSLPKPGTPWAAIAGIWTLATARQRMTIPAETGARQAFRRRIATRSFA